MNTKCIVETNGNFMLLDPATGDAIEANRPSVVINSSFIFQRLGLGQLTMKVASLPKEANDEEFLETLKASDNDFDLAIASYVSKFDIGAETIKKEEPKEEKEEKEEVKPTPAKRGRKAKK